MTHSLLITVRFHEGRYHGTRDGFEGAFGWPPAPGRLFQALVAAAARGAAIPMAAQEALRWLEGLAPPKLAAPPGQQGQLVPQFVPNNDLDAKGGNPARVGEIREGKEWRPIHFDSALPVHYVWDCQPPMDHARTLGTVAAKLHQLGRGLDMASATAEVVTAEELQQALAPYDIVRSPSPRAEGKVAVARRGTFDSLVARHRAARRRFQESAGTTLFVQPPRALFQHIAYDSPARRLHFELREGRNFAAEPLRSAAPLVAHLRDAAAQKLLGHFPDQARVAEKLIVGRGADAADIARRCRIVPLPSVGTEHTDPAIRRLMIELPTEFPLAKQDVRWAFSGLSPRDDGGGECVASRLVLTEDATMASRYCGNARLFRSITALALSSTVELAHGTPASRRRRDERQATMAVHQALRHAGVRTKPTSIRVQREPLQTRGERAEAFAANTRFPERAMWHVELAFPLEITGPLLLGDGRFLGLGLMVPVAVHDDVVSFSIPPRRVGRTDAPVLLHAFRRALMSIARDGRGGVDTLFSGHEIDGRPDSAGRHRHVFLAADVNGSWVSRLVVAAPWAVDRSVSPTPRQNRRFGHVVRKLTSLRAGGLGVLSLQAESLDDDDDMMRGAKTWRTTTPYLSTRKLKPGEDANAVLVADVTMECRRRGLPAPTRVHTTAVSQGQHDDHPEANLVLTFATSVRGPVMLGRNSHKGGGVFIPNSARSGFRC